MRYDVQGGNRWKEYRKSRVEDTISLVPSRGSGENRTKSVAYRVWPLVEDVVMPQPSLMRATPFPPTTDLLDAVTGPIQQNDRRQGCWVMLTGDRLTKQGKAGSHRSWWPWPLAFRCSLIQSHCPRPVMDCEADIWAQTLKTFLLKAVCARISELPALFLLPLSSASLETHPELSPFPKLMRFHAAQMSSTSYLEHCSAFLSGPG